MTEQHRNEAEEARDLRNVLVAGGVSLLCLAPMILVSGPVVDILNIPTTPMIVVAIIFALATAGGVVALRMNYSVRHISWTILVAYTLVVALIVYYSGAPLTPVFLLYLLVVVAAAFLLGLNGATVIAVLGIATYALILVAEYFEWVGIIDLWQIDVDVWLTESESLLIASLFFINWSVVAISTLLTAQLTGSLASRLKSSNTQLRESERLRTNLTDMLVHDLRNPLTALMGWLDIFRATMGDEADDERFRLLENARRSGHVTLGLVGELLDISKLEAGKLTPNFDPVDISQLISDSIDAMRALIEIEDLKVTLDLDADVSVALCDKQLISRVMTNLISNAIKHTPAGGTITLQAHRGQNDVVVVSVSDTGEGIPPEYRRRIFEKFGQVEEPGRERRGTGLGLTFCKMAVEAHGGDIWVESQIGQGSTFYFTLPANPSCPEEISVF